jgi:hypothetical protein
MMTTISRPNSATLLALVVALFVVTWPMFGTFTVATLIAGLVAGASMRAWYWHHPSRIALPDRRLHSEINLSSIPVRGDAGGLLYAIASVALLLGLEPLQWFLIASLACAGVLALVLIVWRNRAPARPAACHLRA